MKALVVNQTQLGAIFDAANMAIADCLVPGFELVPAWAASARMMASAGIRSHMVVLRSTAFTLQAA